MKLNIEQRCEKAVTTHIEGKLEEAEQLYRSILEIQPNNHNILNNLSVIIKDQGKLEEAEIYCKKAIDLKQDFAEACGNLGLILFSLNKDDEAEVYYRKAIKLKPSLFQVYVNLSRLLSKLNRTDEAIINCKHAIKLKPDYAEAYLNLGALSIKLNAYEEAETYCKKAIKFKPDLAGAYANLGFILHHLNKLDDAERNYKKAIELKPDFVEVYNNLGVLMVEYNKLDEAEKNYKIAIELKPDYKDAFKNRGELFFKTKDFEQSLKYFDICNTKDSRPKALASLYALGRTREIYERIEINSELDDKNLKIAAFSSFISNKEIKKTAHRFCNNPMDFIYFSNLSTHIKNFNYFITEMIEELQNLKTRWEPYSKTTKKGFQGFENLFHNPSEKLLKLKLIVVDEINSYYLKFKDETCSYINKWPSKNNLEAWHVILKQQGYQAPHIHPGAWLSGVVYFKVVPTLDKNEGAIELGLNGPDYFDISSPKLIHEPKIGDIVLFPSSLHHRTIPYTVDEDRISIAFDLVPSL